MLFEHLERLFLALYFRDNYYISHVIINATGNPGCTLFNSECTISAGNTLRIGAGSWSNEFLVNFCYYWKTGLELSLVKEARLLPAFGSLVIVAVVKETRLLPAFGSLVLYLALVAVVVETRLLPAFGSLMKVAAVVEMWLLPVFGSLIL